MTGTARAGSAQLGNNARKASALPPLGLEFANPDELEQAYDISGDAAGNGALEVVSTWVTGCRQTD
jgi:hypothetical protein